MRLSPPECPKCKYELTWRDVRGEFECPACKSQLKSNYLGVLIFVAAILPLPFMLYIPSAPWGPSL
jgi:ribosomal protein L37AE/L43A